MTGLGVLWEAQAEGRWLPYALPEPSTPPVPFWAQVLCLHGIGSSSYTYRNTVRLLGEAGHEAVAVDWIGHGASSKVRCRVREPCMAASAPASQSAPSQPAPWHHLDLYLLALHSFFPNCSPPAALTTLLSRMWRRSMRLWTRSAGVGSPLL